MLSIILAVIIARQYLAAADKFNRTKWLWGTIGVLVFFGSQLLMGFVIGIVMAMTNTDLTDLPMNLGINILGMILGFGIAYGILELMKRNAKNQVQPQQDDLLDQFEEFEPEG